MVFYGGDFTEVFKFMVFNEGFVRLFLRFKKLPENTFPKDDLARESATLGK